MRVASRPTSLIIVSTISGGFEMVEILENATVVYVDGIKERFDAICVTGNRIITGRIFKRGKTEEFKECGFISRQNIKHIYNGSKRNILGRE